MVEEERDEERFSDFDATDDGGMVKLDHGLFKAES